MLLQRFIDSDSDFEMPSTNQILKQADEALSKFKVQWKYCSQKCVYKFFMLQKKPPSIIISSSDEELVSNYTD